MGASSATAVIPAMEIPTLENKHTSVIHLIGGGGKTTFMLAMARALAGRGKRVIASTSTRITRSEGEALEAQRQRVVQPVDDVGVRRLDGVAPARGQVVEHVRDELVGFVTEFREAEILQAARQLGIEIPTICYHEACTSNGLCRTCAVEVEGGRVLLASCVAPVSAGMNVRTRSQRVERSRRTILSTHTAPGRCSSATAMASARSPKERAEAQLRDAKRCVLRALGKRHRAGTRTGGA